MSDSLYAKIYDIENLYRASKLAMRGKKRRENVAKFWLNEDRELERIHEELRSKSYKFGNYKTFTITEQWSHTKHLCCTFS